MKLTTQPTKEQYEALMAFAREPYYGQVRDFLLTCYMDMAHVSHEVTDETSRAWAGGAQRFILRFLETVEGAEVDHIRLLAAANKQAQQAKQRDMRGR